jgi:Leucine-rich repeat (LRR) protein
LGEYENVKGLKLPENKITSVKLRSKNLNVLDLSSNNLTSIDFLNTIPNQEELKSLLIYSNKIQPTDISFFSKFVNLGVLKIGNTTSIPGNQFYGSLKAYQNLTKLKIICIEATDVNEGMEYLPFSLAQSAAERAKNDKEQGGYCRIECSPHGTNAKCKAIQDELRPFNYDLEA